MAKQLQLFRSLDPQSMSLGWERDDLPNIIHVIVKVNQGQHFSPDLHYPCSICENHSYRLDDFHQQVEVVLKNGPV